MVLVASTCSMAQTVISLPYEADYSQGWTATGSSYLTADSAVLVGVGDTLYSPWLTAEAGVPVFTTFEYSSNNADLVYAMIIFIDEDGSWLYSSWLNVFEAGAMWWPGFEVENAAGKTFRVAITAYPYNWNEGKKVSFGFLDVYQYNIGVSLSGIDTLDPGQSAVYTAAIPSDVEVDTIEIYSIDESIDVVQNGNTATVTAHTTGYYNVIARATKHSAYTTSYGYTWPASKYYYKTIYVRDTTSYLCPDVVQTVPYEADFAECWTLMGGAELTADGYIKLSAPGQRAVGPWVDIDVTGNLYLSATMRRDNPEGLPQDTYMGGGLTTDGKLRMRNGDYYSFMMDVNKPVSNGQMNFDDYLNGQQIRLEYEYYSGDEPIYISSSALYMIDGELSARIVQDGTVYEGAPFTFNVEHNLGGDNVPDSIVWHFDRGTIVDGDGTTTPTVVFDGKGYHYCYVYLYNNSFSVYASLNVVVVEDTVMHECTVDRYPMPYRSRFTECWTIGGNANIVGSGEARLTAVGDTLHSPWIHIDTDSALLAFSYTSDIIPISGTDYTYYTYGTLHCRFNVVDSVDGVVDSQNSYFGTYGGNDVMWPLSGMAGRTVRVDFLYSSADTVDFVLTKMAVFQKVETVEVVVSGPDTVQMGEEAVFSAIIPNEVTSYYWTNSSNGANAFNTPTFTTTWNSPGVYSVNMWYAQTLYAGYVVSSYATKTVCVVPSDSLVATAVQLPYSADFAEGWELTGGATLTADGRIRLDGRGQKAVSPWLMIGPEGSVSWQYLLERDNVANPDTIHYEQRVVDYSGQALSWSNTWFCNPWGGPARYGEGTYNNGRVLRYEFEYTDEVSTSPLYISLFDMMQTICDVTITGPDTVYVGQLAHFTSHSGRVHHATEAEPEEETATPYYVWNSAINEQNFNYTGSLHRDSIDVYWNTPGVYPIYLSKYYNYYWQGMSASHKSDVHYVTVLPEPADPCDTMVYLLPYTADFTQCWQISEGATITAADQAVLNTRYSTITSPLLHCDSNTIIEYSYIYDDCVADTARFEQCARIFMSLYNVDGSFVKNIYDRYPLNVPTGDYRVRVELGTSCSETYPIRMVEFKAFDTIIVLPDMVIDNAPDTMYVGDTVYMKLRTVDASVSTPHHHDQWLVYRNGAYSITIGCWSDWQMVYDFKDTGNYTFVSQDIYGNEVDRHTIVVRPGYQSPACVISAFPYYEDFSGDIYCWSGRQYNIVSPSDDWQNKALYVYYYYSTGLNGYAHSPRLDMGGRYHLMSFRAKSDNYSYSKLLVDYGAENDTSTATYILDNNWSEYQLLLPPSATYFAFGGINTQSGGSILIDDIAIIPIGVTAPDSMATVVDTIYRDTVVYNVVTLDSIEYNITTLDSVQYNITILDSVQYNITILDSVQYNITILDSVQYNITTLDSVVWNIVQSDSVVYYYDTTCALIDTVIQYLHDTVVAYLHDTVTVYVHDTIYIGDSTAGIAQKDMLQLGIGVNGSLISVDGAEDRTVYLYDAVGRLLATRKSLHDRVSFAVPSSGTYLVKVDGVPARKVVVIR